jgi:carbon-monoxide dehydrogenase iron sulfur subunit
MAQKTLTETVVVNLRRCLGCRSCELACAKAHAGCADIVEAVLAGLPLVPRVHVVAADGCAVPVQCQHCEDAPCVAVCPTGALYVDDEGVVHAAPARCIGCKACLLVCPFGAAQWDPHARTVVRCDLCGDLIEEGQVPYCVAACPTHARRVVRVEEEAAGRRKDSARRTIRVMRAEEKDEQPEG